MGHPTARQQPAPLRRCGQGLTSVVYSVQTSPMVSTALQRSKPVTESNRGR